MNTKIFYSIQFRDKKDEGNDWDEIRRVEDSNAAKTLFTEYKKIFPQYDIRIMEETVTYRVITLKDL